MNLSGIQFRLLFLGVAPTVIVVSSLASYFIQHQYYDLEKALEEKGRITANQLAISSTYGVFSGNTEVLTEITNALIKEADIVEVKIYDNSSSLLAKSEQTPSASINNSLLFIRDVTIHSIKTLNNSAINDFSEPNQHPPVKKIGHVEVLLSLQNTHTKQQDYLVNSLIILGTGVFCTLILARKLTKTISNPIIKLTNAANELANQKMGARAPESDISEIDILCQSFNTMATSLEMTQSHLNQTIDKTVSELNKTLAHLEEKNKYLEKTTDLAVSQNKTKSQFIAHISHEIRTPMNGILGFTELLTKSPLNQSQLNQIQLIKTSASNLLTIINEILDYSSLEAGNFKPHITTFDLREAIENCVSIITPSSGNVKIIIDIDTQIPKIISTDPNHLQQIITNLLGNANKFTYQGHIILRCRQFNDNWLFISISDTGPGIHHEKIKSLFQPFRQANTFSSDDKLGTGLGLSISKNLVERLNGNIGVCSTLETGSTFWFSLPFTSSKNHNLPPLSHSFLLLDGFKLRRQAFAKQLTFLGFQVIEIASIDNIPPTQNYTYDLVFYALNGDHSINDSVLERINTLSKNNVLFITDHIQTDSSNKYLSLPCRSSYLLNVINHKLSSTPTVVQESFGKQQEKIVEQDSVSIFIADDNEINRLLLESQLKPYCKNITLAIDGKSALNYLQTFKYDLILLDLQMPYYSGLELIKFIKEPGAINEDSPIIAITAHAQSHQRKALIEAGFDECLIKPILLESLEELLSLWLPHPAEPQKTEQSSETEYITALLQRTAGDTQLARAIFEKLFSELPEQSLKITQAIENKDLNLAQQITHKMHGSLSFCGFSELQLLAASLEKSFEKNEHANILLIFDSLKLKIEEFVNLKSKIFNQL